MYNREALGAMLRQRRHALSFRLQDVTEKVKVTIAYLSEVERGKRTVSPAKLHQLTRVLKFSVEDYVQAFRHRGRLPPKAEAFFLKHPDQWPALRAAA